MMEKSFKTLNIDTEFQTLIRPLSKSEHSQLEVNLVVDGCRDPIITWNDTVIDGHNRYEICNRLHIPYATRSIDFDSREEAIVWICNNQLGRRNITEETRKYLIGRQYDAEKAMGFPNGAGHNQYTKETEAVAFDGIEERQQPESGRRTATRIGKKYNVSSGAVQKYAKYSEALDVIADKAPELVPQILSGNYKISHENVVALSMMDDDEIQKISSKAQHGKSPFVRYSESRKEFSDDSTDKAATKQVAISPLKTMPEFDPDAEVVGLTLTVPSWTSSIERVRTVSDMNQVSLSAKTQLVIALDTLSHKVQEMLRTVKGEL